MDDLHVVVYNVASKLDCDSPTKPAVTNSKIFLAVKLLVVEFCVVDKILNAFLLFLGHI